MYFLELWYDYLTENCLIKVLFWCFISKFLSTFFKYSQSIKLAAKGDLYDHFRLLEYSFE